MLRCTNDGFGPADEYKDTAEFLAMCAAAGWDAPDLLETSAGVWTDMSTGEQVLADTRLSTCPACEGSGKGRNGFGECLCQSCKGSGYGPLPADEPEAVPYPRPDGSGYDWGPPVEGDERI
jgi:hypothetical protein